MVCANTKKNEVHLHVLMWNAVYTAFRIKQVAEYNLIYTKLPLVKK